MYLDLEPNTLGFGLDLEQIWGLGLDLEVGLGLGFRFV